MRQSHDGDNDDVHDDCADSADCDEGIEFDIIIMVMTMSVLIVVR